MSTESSSGKLDGLLLLGGYTSTDQLHHFAFIRGESNNLSDDFSDLCNPLVDTSLFVRGLQLSCVDFWLSHNKSMIQAQENSTFALHLKISLIINNL